MLPNNTFKGKLQKCPSHTKIISKVLFTDHNYYNFDISIIIFMTYFANFLLYHVNKEKSSIISNLRGYFGNFPFPNLNLRKRTNVPLKFYEIPNIYLSHINYVVEYFLE